MADSDKKLPERNPENGQLLPGNTANPEGKNGHLEGWQPYGNRLQKWMNKSVGELKDLFEDETEMRKLSMIDAACAAHAREMVTGKRAIAARKEAIDRIEGTARQTILIGNKDDKPLKVGFTLNFQSPSDDNAGIQPPETLPKAD